MRMRAAQRQQHHHPHHGAPHHSASTSALPSHTQQNGAQGKPVPWRSSAAMGGKPASQQHPHQAAPVMPPGLSGVSAAAAAGAAAGAAAAAAAVAAGGELGAPPGLPAPGGASAPVSIPARPSASGSSSGGGGGALVGSAHGSSPAAAWAGASSLDAARKEANKVRFEEYGLTRLQLHSRLDHCRSLQHSSAHLFEQAPSRRHCLETCCVPLPIPTPTPPFRPHTGAPGYPEHLWQPGQERHPTRHTQGVWQVAP
jgi:hypothetical protein